MRLPALLLILLLSGGCGGGEGAPRTDRRPPPGPPAPAQGAYVGEVVELACFLRQGARGSGHRPCAEACLKRGMAAGLLTDAGDLYLLIPDARVQDPSDLSGLAAERCEVEGDLVRRSMMKAILYRSVAKAQPPVR